MCTVNAKPRVACHGWNNPHDRRPAYLSLPRAEGGGVNAILQTLAVRGWDEYERRKQEWIRAHPEATPAEYTATMLRIATECGV